MRKNIKTKMLDKAFEFANLRKATRANKFIEAIKKFKVLSFGAGKLHCLASAK